MHLIPKLLTTLLLITWVCIRATAGCARCRHSTTDSYDRVKRTAGQDATSMDDDSENFSSVDLESVRLEYVKHQILQKLGMSTAPKVERKQSVDITPRES